MSNVSVETLGKLKDSMVGRRYKHFKGRTYIVTDIAVHTESDEIMVIYKCFTDPLVTWCRPLAMFTSDVDRENIQMSNRKEDLNHFLGRRNTNE